MTPAERAQDAVKRLRAADYPLPAIAAAGGVSLRTVYRWARGEHSPQRSSALLALERLVAASS